MGGQMKKSDHDCCEILTYLPDQDKCLFLKDILQAVKQSKDEGTFDAVDACIEAWDDTVELLSMPGLQEEVWRNFNRLKDDGFITC